MRVNAPDPDAWLEPMTMPGAPFVQWVVRLASLRLPYEYSTSPEMVLFQLTVRPDNAYRFDRYEDASAHARHLSWIYRQQFQVVARVRASRSHD